MAIYHLTTKIIQRSKGKSAVAAAAYRHAASMYSESEDRTYNYQNKPNVFHGEITIPDNSPPWLQTFTEPQSTETPYANSEKLWNLIEGLEQRHDAQLAREIEIALPIELNFEQNLVLTREYIKDQITGLGMVADWAIHWEEGNPHAHIMLSMREITPDGFGNKVRAWNSKVLLNELRSQWAQYINFHLKLHGHDMKVDHRSYKDQGIELIPTEHEGKAVRQMRERNIKTERMTQANEIRKENLALITEKPAVLLDKISKERETFSFEHVTHELARYANDKGQIYYQEGLLADAILSQEAVNDATVVVDGDEISSDELAQPAPLTPERIATIFKKIEAHDTVFSERTLVEHLSEYTDNAENFTRALCEIKNSPELISLGAGDDGRDRYTTRNSFNVECELVDLTDSLRELRHINITKKQVRQGLKAHEAHTQKKLTAEQRDVVSHILKPSSVSCVVGRAGTGKSFTLGAVASICELAGLRTTGIALSGIAASGLTENGIPSRTIASFALGLEKGTITLSNKDVIVMDEAGMTDVHSMITVLTAIKHAKGKLILVGDHGQLQPVGGGAAFRAILERIGFAEITTIMRQKNGWQREASKELAAGDVATALHRYHANGFVHLEENNNEAMAKLEADWLATYAQLHQTHTARQNKLSCLDSADTLKNMVVLAHTNDAVKELNLRLRENRINLHHIEQGYLTQNADRHYLHIARGERIIFTQNHRRIGVENGQFATITTINLADSGRVLGFNADLDNGKKVLIKLDEYRHFDHSYAVTVHKSQGITRKWSFVFAGGFGWNRHLSYVAHTRHEEGCRTYASKEEHRDEAALFKYLGRFGRKDSLIDFPLAFGLRRGIDMEAAAQRLPKRLALRLADMRDVMQDKVHAALRPFHYWNEKQKIAAEIIEHEKLQSAREDGRLVARYVDASCEVGRCFGELANVMQTAGIDKEHYLAAFADEFIQVTEQYGAFEEAKMARNAIAEQVLQAPARYMHVLKTCGIELDKLEKEANAYTKRKAVMGYKQRLQPEGSTIIRQREAFHLLQTIKEHYPDIKAIKIDTALLREDAFAHIRRQRFLTLNANERAGYHQVEKYRKINGEIAKLLKMGETLQVERGEKTETIINNPESSATQAQNDATLPLSRHHAERLAHLGIERDKLALTLYNNADVFASALDFYHIGLAAPRYNGEIVTEEQIQRATARWYKLQNQAGKQTARERVAEYQAARAAKNTELAGQLANVITLDTKTHHPVILEQGNVSKELWRLIRQDAKTYEYTTHYKSLTPDEQVAFKKAQQYSLAKKAHGSAWREILTEKENQGWDDEFIFKQLAPYAKKYTVARDAIAASIKQATEKTSDYLRYKEALAYFEIDIEALTPQALKHDKNEAVRAYAHALQDKSLTRIQKGSLASKLLEEPKAYYSAMLEHDIAWKTVFQDANAFEAQKAMQFLTRGERKLYRLSKRYRKTNQQLGKTFARLKATNKNKKLSTEQNKIIAHLSSKRDYLAYTLINAVKQANPNLPLSAFESHLRIRADQVTKQAVKHGERVKLVNEYQSAHHDVVESLTSLYQNLCQPKDKQQPQHLASQFKSAQDALAYATTFKHMHWQAFTQHSLSHALKTAGISTAIWQSNWKAIEALKTTLGKLIEKHEAVHGKIIASALPEKALAVQKAHNKKQYTHNRIDVERLRELLNDQVERVALTYLGEPKKRSGKEWRYGDTGKLVVTLTGSKAGYWYDHKESKGGDMLSLIGHATSQTSLKQLAQEASGFLGGSIPMTVNLEFASAITPPKLTPEKSTPHPDALKRLKQVTHILQGTVPITATLAEHYLRARGITSELSPTALRFHPRLKNWMTGSYHPALVIPAYQAGKLCGMQAIFLDPATAKKAELGNYKKLSRGLIGEGALVHQGRANGVMAYAEGLETALSVASSHPDWNVHLTFGVSNFAKAALKNSALDIVLCADNDGADSGTAKSIDKSATILAEKGKNVFVALPPKSDTIDKYDFNDLLGERGLDATQEALNNRTLYKAAITQEILAQELGINIANLTQTNKQSLKETAIKSATTLITQTAPEKANIPVDWGYSALTEELENLAKQSNNPNFTTMIKLRNIGLAKGFNENIITSLNAATTQLMNNPVTHKLLLENAKHLFQRGIEIQKNPEIDHDIPL